MKTSYRLFGLAALVLTAAAALHFGLVDAASIGLLGLVGATQMTPSGARVIDPILTTVAQGYRNADFVGDALFPAVPVEQRGGKIITFGKEDFQIYATARAPGAQTKRVQIGYSGSAYALESHSLEGVVPFELMQEAAAVPGIDLGTSAVRKVQNIIGLRLEKARGDLATTTANYDANHKNTALASTTLWSDATNSDPIGNIQAGKNAIRATIGRLPNTLLISASTLSALQVHSKILDRIKYTGRDVPTAELLASLFGVQRVVVGGGVYTDASGAFVDIWGKTAILAYTELGSLADMGAPSFGYTYQLNGYPIVEPAYQDRNAKSWVYPVTDEVTPVIAGATAGYIISPTVA